MEGREGTLYFQIIHGRVARQINTGYRLFPSEWDGRMSEIILPVSGDARRSLLLALKERMEKDIRRLESIIAGLERSGGTYPASRVVELFHNPPPEDSHNFMVFGKRLVEELERVGKKRTAERYTTVLNSFTHFRGRDGDIPLEDIGSTLMLGIRGMAEGQGDMSEQHLLLHAEPACRLQPCGGQGTDGTAQPFQACLHRNRQDRKTCCSIESGPHDT